MAYVSIKCIREGTHLQQAIDYIKNPDKTENCILISSYMCSTNNTAVQFQEISKHAIKRGNQIAHHICQSFSPEDNITPEQALKIGQELMKRFYPNHQYIIATHTDRSHLHNHIIVNSVNFDDYKKLRNNIKNLTELRTTSDDLCRENNLSIIIPEEKNQREILKKTIDEAIENSNTFDEFLGYMQSKNYEIKRNKYLSFKGKKSKVFFNTKLFGTAYTEKKIKSRIANHTEIKNHKIHIYDDKTVKMSYRKRLKFAIEKAFENSSNYDEFLNNLKNYDFEVKFGKHLAFKHCTADRYIRVDNLGTEYSEAMLKLYFSNNEEYNRLKSEIEESKINKIITSEKAYKSKYIESQNADIQIRMLNYLSENGIKSIDELNNQISDCQSKIEAYNRNIQDINTKISENREAIKSRRMYWQYKPYFTELNNLKTEAEKTAYYSEHKKQLDLYGKAVEILNASKKSDGTLPKATDLSLETERLEKLKSSAEISRQSKIQDFEKLNNIKYNLDKILDLPLDKNTLKRSKNPQITNR